MVCSLWDASSSTLSQGWFLLFLQGTAMFCSFFIPGSCLLSLLLAVTISVFPCFWRFQQLTSPGYEVCRLFYSCICLMFFSWLDLRHIFLEDHLGKITTYYSQHDILLSMLTFITWGGVFQIVHCTVYVCICTHTLTSQFLGHTICSRIIFLCITCLCPRISYFFQGALSFLNWRPVLETKILALGVFIDTEV